MATTDPVTPVDPTPPVGPSPTVPAVLSAVRSILIAVGAMLTAKGYASDATVQEIVGALMIVLPAIWGIVDKVLAERATKAREVVAVNAGIAIADATVGPTPPATVNTAPAIIAMRKAMR